MFKRFKLLLIGLWLSPLGFSDPISFFTAPSHGSLDQDYLAVVKPKSSLDNWNYQILLAPTNTSISSNGILKWTPDSTGNYSFDIQADHPSGASGNFMWSIAVQTQASVKNQLTKGKLSVKTQESLSSSSLNKLLIKKILNPAEDLDQDGRLTTMPEYQKTGLETNHGLFEISCSYHLGDFIGTVPVELWLKKNAESRYKLIHTSYLISPGANQTNEQKFYWNSLAAYRDGLNDNWSLSDANALYGDEVQLKLRIINPNTNH